VKILVTQNYICQYYNFIFHALEGMYAGIGHGASRLPHRKYFMTGRLQARSGA
jgi:hypothetical protein